MKILLAVKLFFMLASFHASGQETVRFRSQQESIHIPDHVEASFLFIPAAFSRARVYYSHQQAMEMDLQYNILQNLMQYPGEDGEIAILEPDNRIVSIVFAEHVFIHDPEEGFLELVSEAGQLELLLDRSISLHFEPVRRGAYGMESPSANIRTYYPRYDSRFERAFPYRYQMTIENHVGAEIEVALRKSRNWYIRRENELIAADSRRALLRGFREHRPQLRQFIRQQDIDLQTRQDLISLTDFISEFYRN